MFYIFIDESGIHKQVDYSTIALVYVVLEDIQKVEQGIIQIEQKLNIKPFHWTRHGWKIRIKFLEKISKLPFTFKVAVFKNPIKFENELENALIHMVVERKIKKIIIDGKKPKRYALKLKKVLRDKGVSVRKVQTAKDESSPGIRIADALSSLIRAYYDNPNGKAKIPFCLIKNKLITTQIMGGQTFQVSSAKKG